MLSLTEPGVSHDSYKFIQELFRDFSIVGEHFPVVPSSGKPLEDEFSGVSLPIRDLQCLFYGRGLLIETAEVGGTSDSLIRRLVLPSLRPHRSGVTSNLWSQNRLRFEQLTR